MFYEPKNGHGLAHNPFKALVAPRPIGWISTISAAGEVNLAPFSFFNAFADNPPVVMFATSGNHQEGGPKDSVKNIEETGEFVCNLVTHDLREAMNITSANVARDQDEFKMAGLTKIVSRLIKPPRVGESPVHLECKFVQRLDLPSNDPSSPNIAILGEVVGVHIDDNILKDGLVDQGSLKILARMGYMDYCIADNLFTLQRPS